MDTQEAMDGEGFPQTEETEQPNGNPVSGFQSFQRGGVFQDQDSGEVTFQRVVILRRAPKLHCPIEDFMNPHLNFMFLTRRMPSFNCCHPMRLKRKDAAHPSFMRMRIKHQFRIPFNNSPGSTESQDSNESTESVKPPKSHHRTQGERKINVSIWKEYFFGDKIFDVSEMSWKEAFYDNPHCPMIKFRKKVSRYLSWSCIKPIVIILVLIKLIMIHLNVVMYLVHLNWKHEKIHRKCEEKGIKPVFTGSPYQGPIMWTVRNVTCLYCRDQKQSDVSLRLLKILNEERKSQQVKGVNKTQAKGAG